MKNNSNFFITIAKSKSLILNEWAVYSTGTISTNEIVNDVSVIPKEIQSGDHIKIQPGCQVRTMQNLIYMENEDKFSLQPLVFQWTWDAKEFFLDHGSQAVQDAIGEMELMDRRIAMESRYAQDGFAKDAGQQQCQPRCQHPLVLLNTGIDDHWNHPDPGHRICHLSLQVLQDAPNSRTFNPAC